jgi:hypothetical protein
MRQGRMRILLILGVVLLGSCVVADQRYEGSLTSLQQMASAARACGVWRIKIEPPDTNCGNCGPELMTLRVSPPLWAQEKRSHQCLEKWLQTEAPKDIGPFVLIGD